MRLAFVLWVVIFSLCATLPERARADAFADAVEKLASEDVGEIKQGIAAVANAGDPRALPLLTALREGRLRVDTTHSRVLWEKNGAYAGVLDGAAGPAGGGRAIVVNNAIRKALTLALARLELSAQDVQIRRAAAESLASAPSAEVAPSLREAWRKEAEPSIKRTLALALAQVDLDASDPAQRLSAVKTLGETGELSFKPRLERLTEKNAEGAYLEPDEEVRRAAEKVLASLWWTEAATRLVGDLMYGLSLGSVLLLAALGLAITFGLMGVINMAHGEMLMLGAYVTYAVQVAFQRHAPEAFAWYVAAALPAAFVVCAAVGMMIERGILRFLYGRPLETLLATWGVSLGLIQTVRLIFGAQNVAVAAPAWLSGGYELTQGIVLPYNRVAIVVFAGLVLAFVWLLLTRTRLGLHVRAVTQNRAMAACMGIRTARVDMWTFGVGSGVAGLGGVALSQIGNVGPELGQGYIVDSFMVVVLGGVGKLAGTVAGSFGLGIVNKLLEPLSGAVLGKIIVLALIILFIQKRPQGIFALKGRMVEG